MTPDGTEQIVAYAEQLLEAARPVELVYEYPVVRLAPVGESWALQIRTIYWDGPHNPKARWVYARPWPAAPTHSELVDAAREFYASPDYFRTCAFCRQAGRPPLHLRGHMHDDKACHACASQHDGVVY